MEGFGLFLNVEPNKIRAKLTNFINKFDEIILGEFTEFLKRKPMQGVARL